MIEIGGLVFWQWWLILMVTINTFINIIVFFKHRFRRSSHDKTSTKNKANDKGRKTKSKGERKS